jgi:hypothetical protein
MPLISDLKREKLIHVKLSLIAKDSRNDRDFIVRPALFELSFETRLNDSPLLSQAWTIGSPIPPSSPHCILLNGPQFQLFFSSCLPIFLCVEYSLLEFSSVEYSEIRDYKFCHAFVFFS